MIGDINLFLTDDCYSDSDSDSDSESDLQTPPPPVTATAPSQVVGEIEIMIASRAHHRQGYGRAALLAFMWYILAHQQDVLQEYGSNATYNIIGGASKDGQTRDISLKYLRVKIGQENAKSISLFESIGFEKTGAGPNYFGEVELRFAVNEEAARKVGGAKGFDEVKIATYVFN